MDYSAGEFVTLATDSLAESLSAHASIPRFTSGVVFTDRPFGLVWLAPL